MYFAFTSLYEVPVCNIVFQTYLFQYYSNSNSAAPPRCSPPLALRTGSSSRGRAPENTVNKLMILVGKLMHTFGLALENMKSMRVLELSIVTHRSYQEEDA